MDEDLVKGLVDDDDEDNSSFEEEGEDHVESGEKPEEEDVEALLAKMESEDLAGDAEKSAQGNERYRAAELARRFDSMFGEVMEIRMLMEPLMAAFAKGGETGDEDSLRKLVDCLLELRSATQAGEVPPAKKMKKTLDEQWEEIEAGRSRRLEGWKATMDSWRRRTQLGAAALKHGLTAVNLGPFESARMTLENDRERALKKMHPVTSDSTELDRETYDDAPFYRVLLKDFVDAKKRPDDDTFAVTAKRALGMPTLKTKMKREPAKSKGRRLRFEPHEKLLNFMYPVEKAGGMNMNVDVLLRSLFSDNNTSRLLAHAGDKEVSPAAADDDDNEAQSKRRETGSFATAEDDEEDDDDDDGFQIFAT